MVEMMETARILRQATRRSLVILDEIGRGTSTYDGVALAWAVVEDLARRAGGELRTLFATHYHELTALEGRIPGVFTMNIAIREYNNDILFLHKLVPGPSDRSYGVEVARLAGVPVPVVQRARAILGGLERGREGARKAVSVASMSLPGWICRKRKLTPSCRRSMPRRPQRNIPWFACCTISRRRRSARWTRLNFLWNGKISGARSRIRMPIPAIGTRKHERRQSLVRHSVHR